MDSSAKPDAAAPVIDGSAVLARNAPAMREASATSFESSRSSARAARSCEVSARALLKVSSENLRLMRLAARQVVTSRHTYNLADVPVVIAGKTGTAEFGVKDSRGRLPFHNWFVAFVPKHGDVAKPDSELAVIGFAYDSNTVGNVATEMVKYYLQLHFNVRHDYRRFDLLRKGNFYGGN